jgi:hypothetical protein
MNSKNVYRGLGNENWINKKTNPKSVGLKAFLRKPKDKDGLSVFDEEENCHRLRLFGTAELSIQDLLAIQNPITGLPLKICYNDPTNSHHLIIEGLPFPHEHPAEANTLAINIAERAMCWKTMNQVPGK